MQNKERGAVALITAMVVSILLLITTSGMVALTLKSLKGSTDGAQSTKAYYAAEGGLEEALLKIRNKKPADNCPGSANTPESAKDGVVTCVKTSTTPTQVEGTLDADQSVQIDLSGVAGLQTVGIEWSTPTGTGATPYSAATIPQYSDANGSKFVSRGTAWLASAPAVLEVGAIQFPAADQFLISDVQYYQATLAPKSITPGHPSYSIGQSNGTATSALANLYDFDDGNNLNKPFVVGCREAAPYQCKATAFDLKGSTGTQGKKYMLRLKSRYNGASYKITVYGANNAPLVIPGAMYTIDVTARAGDTFRRIQTSFPVGEAPNMSMDGLDYVLYSDTDICKSFELQGTSPIGIGCNPPF